MKLNLGCGFKRLDGFLNIDKETRTTPDAVIDIEALPWPWETESVDEIHASHVLEHVGQTPALFIGIMQEAWRVLKCGALFVIAFPDVHHDSWWADPTHVRPLTPRTFLFFSRRIARDWGIIEPEIDFDFIHSQPVLDPALAHLDLTDQKTLEFAIHQNNVTCEWHVKLRKRPIA